MAGCLYGAAKCGQGKWIDVQSLVTLTVDMSVLLLSTVNISFSFFFTMKLKSGNFSTRRDDEL